MSGTEGSRPTLPPPQTALGSEWKQLSRAASVVALLTAPAIFVVLYVGYDWGLGWSLLATVGGAIAFRGLVDVVAHRLIPRPSTYGADREALLDDALQRRRTWFWRGKYRILFWVVLLVVVLMVILGESIGDTLGDVVDALASIGPFALIFPIYFLFNFGILLGPMLMLGMQQMKGYEPGDADWGVRLDDVRGQTESKEEVTRVIQLWQSGEEFRKAGGKPERGLLFIGSPGTGKTMLSKAIATSFNSPIVTMPGSGFAQTFIGIDVVIVRILIRKARKLARKWGGQCIIFIDEIDAVGLRRAALGGGGTAGGFSPVPSFEDLSFHGPWGAQTASGDLILETRAWRERLFASRAEAPRPMLPPGLARIYGGIQNFAFPGGMGGMGSGALNQLLVQMDGVDEPRWSRKFWTNRVNNLLDASYVVPRKIGSRSLRVTPPPPRSEEIYFIGATNVPIDRLDPALVRPGRMGRHIWFRTPTKDDRLDIFDLYLAKVAHDPDLDSTKRRDELARITNGYSPAMIEQVCSMALTYAHSDGRAEFAWDDIVEAMTTIESGTAVGTEYVAEETRAVAIHEAGHAVASHVYMQGVLSTRLSIRQRGGSLGHHQAIEKEERFSSWRHEEAGKLVWTLGAMAAEHVFYGENSTGVGGDVQSATWRAAWMVGMCGMGPEPVPVDDDEERKRIEERYERIGLKIVNRASGMRESGDPLPAILGDPYKRAAAAQILGQAYITAVCLIRHNRDAVLRVAERLIERRELHGDEVVELLDSVELEAPAIDVRDETIWPKL
jgi:ATP-dependent Zn protease